MVKKLSCLTGIVFLFAGSFFSRESGAQTTSYPDTLWIPVIFYDYWVDTSRTNPDFEIANASNTPGMVETFLDSQRKPIPTPVACPSNPPLACNLDKWFRVSGSPGYDNSLIFTADSSNKMAQRWYWTTSSGGSLPTYLGRSGEFVGPNYSDLNTMRNVVIYDSLPFIHLGVQQPSQIGVYEFARSTFFWIDGRGFGEQPAGSGHNFGFTMELHTSFVYKAGLTFTFTGDDDTWVFINGKRVIDLGGRHGPATATISLDTIPGFVHGKSYPIDFFYAERHTTGSDIKITSNIIAAQPSRLRLNVSGDSICPGSQVSVIGTLIDDNGLAMGNLSDSISWIIDPATLKPGDAISSLQNDTTWFTAGTGSGRRVGVVGSYKLDSQIITNTAWIYIKDCSSFPFLTSAITRDLNGNGLIDHIELVFSDSVKLDSTMLAGFLVRGTAGAFYKEGISKINDSTYRITLTEIKTAQPQTAWTPEVTITNLPNIQPKSNFRTIDGCPPVVWEVKKYIIDSNRTHDTVKIFLSEKITNATGGTFSTTTSPSDVFHVWVASGSSYALADTMFAGIPGFSGIIGDSILVLAMSNGRDLGTGNYINIRDNNLIRDKAGNSPSTDNQRVKVTIVVGDIFTIIVGPNPARPALNHPGELKFEHNANAVNWVRRGEGTIISLQDLSIPVNSEDAKNVKAHLKIVDVVGNPVNWCKTTDMFAKVPTTGGTAPAMNLYWNGLNNEGMVVAPGVYRVVVYIDYPAGSKIPDARVVSKIGIRR